MLCSTTAVFTCELNQAKADVLWRRNGAEINPSLRLKIQADGLRRSLTISKVTVEDEGEYLCESKDDITTAKLTTKGNSLYHFIDHVLSWLNSRSVSLSVQKLVHLYECL